MTVPCARPIFLALESLGKRFFNVYSPHLALPYGYYNRRCPQPLACLLNPFPSSKDLPFLDALLFRLGALLAIVAVLWLQFSEIVTVDLSRVRPNSWGIKSVLLAIVVGVWIFSMQGDDS